MEQMEKQILGDRKECSENSGEIAHRIDEEKFDETDGEKVEQMDKRL